MSEMVKIYIKATNQYTTAAWKLEGYGNDDIRVCVLENIADFQWMTFWNFSSVKIEFADGRIKERMFYYDPLRERLTQVDGDELSFWISKESEEKSMKHNVIVKKSEEKVIQEYWLIKVVKDKNIDLSKTIQISKEKVCDHQPTPEEIAQFLFDTGSDFAIVEQRYRFESELPFC